MYLSAYALWETLKLLSLANNALEIPKQEFEALDELINQMHEGEGK